MPLILPAPAPPSSPAAAADNGVVHLSWMESPDAVAGYHVYRTADAGQPYARVTGSPQPGGTYDDAAVVNSTTYYYAVVAVDLQGFESAWSNRNSDCDVSGPDCVRATPINPDPPSTPTGVAASSQGSPDRVLVSWNPNPEPDIDRYRVHWGLAPGVYTASVDAAEPATQVEVPGLETNTEYFFAVEAENTSSLVSPRSDPVSATPRLLLGIRPPATVSGLAIVVPPEESTSLDLLWSASLDNIYGEATSVLWYRIYRGPSAGFVPDLDSPLATVAAPETSYRDGGAAVAPGDYYYLVVAEDSDGFLSGVARELPEGILDLEVSLQGDGSTVDLSWSAVTQTVGGDPTSVVGYEVHGQSLPLPRSSVAPSTLLGQPASPGFSHVPPGGIYFYTVLPVDNRGARSPY
jgi:fibronectin type 3 domain-containing protein